MGKDEEELIRASKPKKKSLLETYEIPIEHLSYEYISECINAKELTRIISILRSGEEGTYPDLLRHAEERLFSVEPTSIILRKAEPVRTRSMLEPNERKEIDNDINNWMTEMQSREKDLQEGKSNLTNEPAPQPDIRQVKGNLSKQIKSAGNANKATNQSKRISSCDYAAWDKYDVDTEINKIDLQDERERLGIKRFQQKHKEQRVKNHLAKDVIINKSNLTGTELDVMAEQEREKGNEAFRAADYNEALQHYNCSININSNLVTFNNRALTFIKLQRYEDAINDCSLILNTEHTNIKALLRRAVAFEHLEKPTQALKDYETVLKLEPNNKVAINGVKKIRKPCESRKVRMKIEETVECAGEELRSNKVDDSKNREWQSHTNAIINNSICLCDRAPGPSRNLKPRPHFKADYCLDNENLQKLTNINRALNDIKLSARETKSESFSRNNSIKSPRNSASALNKPKSIFSHITPTQQTKQSSIIIEELPNETSDNTPVINGNNKLNSITTVKNKNNVSRNTNNKSHVDKKLLISDVKGIRNNQDESVERNKKPPKSCCSPKKIQVAEKYENKFSKPERDIPKNFKNIDTPFGFISAWQSLKNDKDLKVHAQLLRSVNSDNFSTGNKLDGQMFSTILRCLERHFCKPEDRTLLNDFLKSFSQVHRFSLVRMFMDTNDKKALLNIFNFLGEDGKSELRQVYCV